MAFFCKVILGYVEAEGWAFVGRCMVLRVLQWGAMGVNATVSWVEKGEP